MRRKRKKVGKVRKTERKTKSERKISEILYSMIIIKIECAMLAAVE